MLVLCSAFAAAPGSADLAPQTVGHESFTVSADAIAYYSDAAIVQARGNVRVRMPDGTLVAGDALSFDLSLRRFVVAGHVLLQTSSGAYSGAAFADFLPFRRAYFVPLDPAADRWTFLNGDYAHPEMGRVMPGDAFFLPDMSGVRAYVTARTAIIDPSTYVKFAPATVAVMNGPAAPLPSFVYNFSQDPNFGVNALSGATFDAPYDFNGTSASLDALHLRYDQTRAVKAFLSYEHHSTFGNGGYAVFSLNPATQPAKQWNLLGYDAAGSRTAIALNAQLFTVQSGIQQPSSASAFVDVALTHALAESSLRFDVTQGYGSLLPGTGTPNHPFIAGLTWIGFDQSLWPSGVRYRLQSGIAIDHDAFGVAGLPVSNAVSRFGAVTLYTPALAGPLGTSVNASFQAARSWTTLPNTLRDDSAIVSAGKRLAEKLYAVASASIASTNVDNPGAVIVSPNVATGFVPQPLSPNGLPVYDGVATVFGQTVSRTYAAGVTWQPSASFQGTVSAQRERYAPLQYPAPYQAAAAFRMRLNKTLFATIGRTYFFNWQNQRWSPQFTFQVTPQ